MAGVQYRSCKKRKVMAALLVKFLEALFGAVLSPTVLPLIQKAVRQIMSDELVNAPKRGEADEEFEKKVVVSGMADVPLPGHHPDA